MKTSTILLWGGIGLVLLLVASSAKASAATNSNDLKPEPVGPKPVKPWPIVIVISNPSPGGAPNSGSTGGYITDPIREPSGPAMVAGMRGLIPGRLRRNYGPLDLKHLL
jgi:hypothetical protein